MKNDYVCPHCRGHLKVHQYIVISARTEDDRKGLLFLSPEIGDYTSKTHPTLKLETGKHVDYYCPICHADLAAKDVNNNLARIIKVDESGTEDILLFSEIAGEKCTYVIHPDDEMDTFGDDCQHYMNFFGEKPKYHL